MNIKQHCACIGEKRGKGGCIIIDKKKEKEKSF